MSAIKSIASKIGYTAETLRTWVRRTEIDQEGIRVAFRLRIVSGSRNFGTGESGIKASQRDIRVPLKIQSSK